MAAIFWIVRVLKYWLIAWVLLSWIPGLAGSDLYMLIGLPVAWLTIPFSFLHTDTIDFSPIPTIFILNIIERWAARNMAGAQVHPSTAPIPDAREMQPASGDSTHGI